jgi:hypothetical protein
VADVLLTHAREFTTIEVEVDQIWNALQDAGLGALARDLLDAGLMLEHYTANLPHDFKDRTPDQLKQQAELRVTFDDLSQKARAALKDVVDSKQPAGG